MNRIETNGSSTNGKINGSNGNGAATVEVTNGKSNGCPNGCTGNGSLSGTDPTTYDM